MDRAISERIPQTVVVRGESLGLFMVGRISGLGLIQWTIGYAVSRPCFRRAGRLMGHCRALKKRLIWEPQTWDDQQAKPTPKSSCSCECRFDNILCDGMVPS